MLACKYITPMGIEVVSVSVKNVLACKYIAPMGIKVLKKIKFHKKLLLRSNSEK